MAMRSAIISRKALFRLSIDSSSSRSRSSFRFFSDQGRVLSEEKRAAENVYIKKMEEEKLEKQSSSWAELAEVLKKAEKDKAEKDKAEKVRFR